MGNYFLYITTNPAKTVLYAGVTNDLYTRLKQHYENRGDTKTFAGRFFFHRLIYFERFSDVKDAIAREKEIKNWSRLKNEKLIKTLNPNWNFLNDQV